MVFKDLSKNTPSKKTTLSPRPSYYSFGTALALSGGTLQNLQSVAFRDTPEPRSCRNRPLKGRQEGRARAALVITHKVM